MERERIDGKALTDTCTKVNSLVNTKRWDLEPQFISVLIPFVANFSSL